MKKRDNGIATSTHKDMQDKPGKFILRLFVTWASPNSIRAIENTRNICETYLAENYELEIIDVYQQPLLAAQEQPIALPMLVKSFPAPATRFVGDMSDLEKVLAGLGINRKKN